VGSVLRKALMRSDNDCSCKEVHPKSIYNVEGKANVVGVGTDFKFKIFSGKLLDVAPMDFVYYR
jgi:hypothetical protein